MNITGTPTLSEQSRAELLRTELNRLVSWLATTYGAREIILFGSMASGRIGPWSDLDLVVVKETALPFLERAVEVIEQVRPRVGLDLLVYTPAEWETVQHRRFTHDEITDRGQVLYAT